MCGLRGLTPIYMGAEGVIHLLSIASHVHYPWGTTACADDAIQMTTEAVYSAAKIIDRLVIVSLVAEI